MEPKLVLLGLDSADSRPATGRWVYAWLSAAALGILCGGMPFLVGSVVLLLSSYKVFDIPASQFAITFLLIGTVVGGPLGLLLGLLKVGWRGTDRFLQYGCEGYPLSRIAQVVCDVAGQDTYQLPGDIVPFCQNRFGRLLFTPNSDPAFSEQPPTPNGGYNAFAELVRRAQYEVSFATMEYDKDRGNDSPGSVLAENLPTSSASSRQTRTAFRTA